MIQAIRNFFVNFAHYTRAGGSDKHKKPPNGGFLSGARGRDRTADTRIFSPLLYQLSYPSMDNEKVYNRYFFYCPAYFYDFRKFFIFFYKTPQIQQIAIGRNQDYASRATVIRRRNRSGPPCAPEDKFVYKPLCRFWSFDRTIPDWQHRLPQAAPPTAAEAMLPGRCEGRL